ncbi:5-oxoprolinase subunit C family protein [Desulfotalea psychrophila]|uniref:Carboxyltransferase domain-containing protein n=1 Tax=Desulfotalea psychrophila (strain LSv54 / DSM 12343) TaxID=177439 RepID=Q6ANH5_DESPS|nr:biotin-dependent carboxyltransferase family protein [Desulfotalea psychrophila]CAG36099.1 conserved hypothetical protein [Desulfotalea psychrophila LSv54]
MATMQVLTGGFLTTIQDQGREKCQQLGLAEAGALDKHAFFWANRILQNHPETPALEILVGNSSFLFDAPSRIAITGAEMEAKINGVNIPNWSSIAVYPGDKLSFGIMKTGLRSYLSLAGGFSTSQFFGSSSTVIREVTGGNDGKKLAAGDRLHYKSPATAAPYRLPKKWIPDYQEELILRFTAGYHFAEFQPESIKEFLSKVYTVSNDADRMGYRLNGTPLLRTGNNILSTGVPCGAIQIPSAGEPIILLNDRQCTGGYPIVGVICQRDIFRLAQRKPGDKVRFQLAEVGLLQKESATFYDFFYHGQI